MADAMDVTPSAPDPPPAPPGPSRPVTAAAGVRPPSPAASSSDGDAPAAGEDPLYDPDADDADEAWVAARRGGRTSDAVLSCVACLTTVCLESQAHVSAPGRFRALETLNCRLDPGATVPVGPARAVGGKRKVVGADGTTAAVGGGSDAAGLTAVVCDACGEVVGAADGEGVVHFFSVIASEA